MVRENIDIVVNERGSRVVKRNLSEIGQSAQSASRNLRLMQNALFVLGGAGAIRSLQRTLDTLTNYENRLRLTSTTMENLNFVQAELFELANRSRTAFAASAEIYTRAALSLKELGVSQREVLRLTESLNKATILSGASAREASAGLVQFAQGLASNRLSGDELRSVLEQLPFVADVIAKSLGVTRGELRELGQQGELTAGVILEAFRSARQEIDERFADTVPTIEQAFEVFNNKFLEVLDSVNDFIAGSDNLARALITVGGLLDEVAIAALAVSTALAGRFLVTAITRTAAFVSSQRELGEAVRAGNATLLTSVEIERAKAQASLQSASATGAQTAARVRDLEVQRRQLQSTLASIEAQRASEAITISNGRARSVLTGRFVQQKAAQDALNSSTKALITTQRALATTDAQLAAARSAAAGAATAEAAAIGRVAQASAAASGTVARLTRLSPALGTLAAGLGRIVTFLGGPLNVAIGLIVGGLFLIESRSERIRRITNELEEDVIELAAAYDDVRGNVKALQDELTRTTLSQSLEQVEEIANEVESTLGRLSGRFVSLAQLNVGSAIKEEFAQISVELRTGEANLKEVRNRLSEIGAQDEKLRPLVNQIIEMVNEGISLEDALARAEAKARLLAGTATDADKAILGLSISADNASGSIRNMGEAAEAANRPIRELIDSIPQLAAAAKAQDELREASEAYNQEVQLLQQEFRGGLISLDQYASKQSELSVIFDRAVSEIDGTAGALREAGEALDDYSSDTHLRTLDARSRAIAEERSEYEQLIQTLNRAGASQAEFQQAESDFATRIAEINREFDERERSKGGGSRKAVEEKKKEILTFEEAIAAIQRETEALKLNADQRAIANELTNIEREIKRSLTPEEEALARAKLQTQLTTEREVELLNEIQGPQQELALRLRTLNSLFSQGKISVDEYNESLRDIAVAATEADNSFAGGLANGLARIAQQANDLGKNVSSFVVGAFNKATEAVVTFAQTGRINIRAFFADLFAQLLRLATQQLFIRLLGLAIGGVGGAAGSGFGFGSASGVASGAGSFFPLPGAQHGADFKVGGTGGTDSQLVAFKATPDERVRVTTPRQEEEEKRRDRSDREGIRATTDTRDPLNLKVVNILDNRIVGDFLQSREGERVIVNVIKRSGVLAGA